MKDILKHAQERVAGFGEIGQFLSVSDAFALGYMEAHQAHMNYQKRMKAVLDLQNKVHQDMFGHCLSNGVFNAWGKPFDCTEMNEVKRAVELLLKEAANEQSEQLHVTRKPT